MVHLIPNKLKSLSRPSSPVPSRSSTPKAQEMQSAAVFSSPPLTLQIAIIQARDLIAKDKSGTSDPFVVLTYNDQRFSTQTIYKTLAPVWNAVFDVTINASLGSEVLEAVLWDRDRFKKDYLGELSIHLTDLFPNGALALDDPTNEGKWMSLNSSRKKPKLTSGEVEIKAGLIDPAHPDALKEDLQSAWEKFLANLGKERHPLQAVIDQPATESVATGGMVRAETFDSETLGASADELDEGDTTSETEEVVAGKKVKKSRKPRVKRKMKPFEFVQGPQEVLGVVFMEVNSAKDLPPERNMTRTGYDMDPFVIVSFGKKTFRTRVIRHNLNPVFNERVIFQVMNGEKNYVISFNVYDRDRMTSNDFVASAVMPVSELISAAPTCDPETGLYQLPEPWKDPDAGRPKPKRQETKLSRLVLSRSNSAQNLNGKKGNNNNNGGNNNSKTAPTSVPSSTSVAPSTSALLTSNAELTRALSSTSLSDSSDSGTLKSEMSASPMDNKELKNYVIPLKMRNQARWEDKHAPELIVNAKYVPYAALRQQLWRCLLAQYDVDDSGRVTRVELVTMLDAMGSTLSEETINTFFVRFRQTSDEPILKEAEEITIDQAVICLEDQLFKKSKGPAHKDAIPVEAPTTLDVIDDTSTLAELDKEPISDSPGEGVSMTSSEVDHSSHGLADPDDNTEEHVIMITECPLCHQPRMNKRSEVDMVTHLATCASQDWRRVDRFVMGGFVTSDQAHRKWYTKVISKITYGGYKLGANSANILVQDRLTGQIQEERMSVYVRLGIRLLYKGLKSTNMERQKVKQLLRSLSVKQGRKYDSTLSAREIKGFIEFHQLDMSEVLLPVEDFKTFNEFFYRKLKPEARPCTAPDNSSIAVSPADCRSVVFNKISAATEIWIKGREFTVQRLFGNAYPEEAAKFEGGALGIFRLAPQDYHRFHVPVDGVLGEPKLIEGQYYTVNPMAIRSTLDVYGENIRTLVPIDTEAFGRVMVVCVGAMMVGSTVITAKTGQKVRRTDELGYFKFGGSTVLLLFQPGSFVFDDDLVSNSHQSLETLLRVGQSIGHHPSVEQIVSENEKMEHVTEEDLRDAARRIGGSLAN